MNREAKDNLKHKDKDKDREDKRAEKQPKQKFSMIVEEVAEGIKEEGSTALDVPSSRPEDEKAAQLAKADKGNGAMSELEKSVNDVMNAMKLGKQMADIMEAQYRR